MNVLFLDVDGVLNSWHFFEVASGNAYRRAKGAVKAMLGLEGRIDPASVRLLNRIIEATDAHVVISSSVRNSFSIEAIVEALEGQGFLGNVIDVTPSLGGNRGRDIAAWLEDHPEFDSFVILDDRDDMGQISDHLVQTHWKCGLEAKHVTQAIKILERGDEA